VTSLVGGSRGVAVVLAAVLLASCREEPSATVADRVAAVAAAPDPVPPEGARLQGVVSFAGGITTASFPRGEDAACAHRSLAPVEVPSVERNAANRVAGALVIAQSAQVPTIAEEPRELRISGCRFSSPIVVLEGAQKLRIVSEDDALHSLVADVEGGSVLDIGLPFAGMSAEVALPPSEGAIQLRCRRHPWMSAFVVRVDRRVWAVTDGDGRFAMAGLADGPQAFAIWHPWLGDLEVTATVAVSSTSEGAPLELTYTDSARTRRDPPAAR
jgi:hypothetical protein